MLSDYKGYIQTDGYVGYTAWLNDKKHAAEKSTILHAACRAHARRKFVETPENSNARKIVKLIAKLYQIETRLRENPELDRADYLCATLEALPTMKQHEAADWTPARWKSSLENIIT